jgi:hypothetical protein
MNKVLVGLRGKPRDQTFERQRQHDNTPTSDMAFEPHDENRRESTRMILLTLASRSLQFHFIRLQQLSVGITSPLSFNVRSSGSPSQSSDSSRAIMDVGDCELTQAAHRIGSKTARAHLPEQVPKAVLQATMAGGAAMAATVSNVKPAAL